MLQLIKKIRNYMGQNGIESLLINTCDEFLLEYNELKTCARYLVTGFSGSCGEVLLTQDKLFLFVDGRYHIQAEQETDPSFVTVVKLQQGERFSDALINRIDNNSTFGICKAKVSLNFYETIQPLLVEKNVSIRLLDEDLVLKFANIEKAQMPHLLEQIPVELCEKTTEEKIEIVLSSLKENEAALFTKLEDVAYLTNLRAYYIEYASSFKGYFLVTKNNAILFTNDNVENIAPFKIQPLKNVQEYLEKLVKNYIVLFEKSSINLQLFDIIKDNCKKISSVENANIFNLKSIKNKQEIEHYKSAFKRTDEVVEYINELVNSNEKLSEYDLAQIVEKEFKKRGAKSLSFKTIMAFGTNTALIHYTNNSKERFLQDGDFVLLDCGAYFEGGLATDITRTFIRGKATKEQKQLYTSVLKGFIKGFQTKLEVGATGSLIDENVRNSLNNAHMKGFAFPHGTGHGVGVCVHETPPSISSSQWGKYPLESGMVFSIEPGLYKENFGGVRIENIVYIDENYKIQPLSKAKLEEKLIDFELLNEDEKEFVKKWNT